MRHTELQYCSIRYKCTHTNWSEPTTMWHLKELLKNCRYVEKRKQIDETSRVYTDKEMHDIELIIKYIFTYIYTLTWQHKVTYSLLHFLCITFKYCFIGQYLNKWYIPADGKLVKLVFHCIRPKAETFYSLLFWVQPRKFSILKASKTFFNRRFYFLIPTASFFYRCFQLNYLTDSMGKSMILEFLK